MAHGVGIVRRGAKDDGPEEPDSKSTWRIVGIMFALCISVFLAALDQTIVSTALPNIAANFQSATGYTWIGSAYLLGNAAATPSWGAAADAWGRRPVLLGAVALFFVSSLISALAPNIGALIAGRAIQGIAGGGLIALPNICVSDLFSVRKRANYFAIFGILWAVSCAVGPVLGGALAEKVSWRWCFYINLPFSGLSFILLILFLDLKSQNTSFLHGLQQIDWTGSIIISGATVMFLLGLDFGGIIRPWTSAMVICLIVFGVAVAGIFIIFEWRHAKQPVIPLRVFQRRSNVAALLVCFFHGMVFISGIYYLPLYFQAVLGASPILSGVYILPYAVTFSVVAGLAGGFINHTGRVFPPVIVGICIMILGFGLYINFDADSSWAKIILFQIVAGIGAGPNFQAPLIVLQSLVATSDMATATATYTFVKTLGTAISIVLGGVVFQNRIESKTTQLVRTIGEPTASLLTGPSSMANVDKIKRLSPTPRYMVREAFAKSLSTMWIFYAALGGLALIASLFIDRRTLEEAEKEMEQVDRENSQAQEHEKSDSPED